MLLLDDLRRAETTKESYVLIFQLSLCSFIRSAIIF